jgi:phospholipase/carboxylesterase
MPTPPMVDAIFDLLPPLLRTLDVTLWAQRNLHPPVAGRLAERVAQEAKAIAGPLETLNSTVCPDELSFMRARLAEVANDTVALVAAFVEAADTTGDFIGLYRALRRVARVQEALYPLAPAFDPISRWFLEPDRRGDDALVGRLRDAALRDEPRAGIMHASNERDARGGFSLYVPETWDGRTAMPLVVALHGGHGHGRDFLWTWLREGRSRGVLVAAPTSRGRTWSMMGEDVDAELLAAVVAEIGQRYPIDRGHVLLTGMSDGATYGLLAGLREGSPFTHLAALCGVLHPFLFANGGLGRAKDRPIYLVHGALDWMFPVEVARQAHDVLVEAGAHVVYRELRDLSHTYPRDENAPILDWLLTA